MKRLVATAIALSTLGALPVVAETAEQQPIARTNYSLILRYTGGGGTSMIAVPMESEEQCEIAGATMESSKTFTSDSRNIGFQCVESK